MTKEDKQLSTMRKNLSLAERTLGRVIYKATTQPDSFEARGKEVLVRKYYKEVQALRKRIAKLQEN